MSNSEKNDEWENALSTLKKTKREVSLSKDLGQAVWKQLTSPEDPLLMPVGESIEITSNKDFIVFMNNGQSGFTLNSAEQLKLPQWK